MITHCISTYNNLPYLKLVLQSIKQNAKFKKVIVYAENCTDGTDEWLKQTYGNHMWPNGTLSEGDVKFYIDKNEVAQGIGGGMNKCAELVETPFINFLHSDMWVSKDFELPLLKIVENEPWTIASSWRIEPNIFGGTSRMGTTVAPVEEFGQYHTNFDHEHFDQWAAEFVVTNKIKFRKAEGVSFLIKKCDWDLIGGNDPLFAPASFDDHDLFARMTMKGFQFVETSESLVFHFGARGSIFRGDNLKERHPRQVQSEQVNFQKWVKKWGAPPVTDQYGFIVVTPEMARRFGLKYVNNVDTTGNSQ